MLRQLRVRHPPSGLGRRGACFTRGGLRVGISCRSTSVSCLCTPYLLGDQIKLGSDLPGMGWVVTLSIVPAVCWDLRARLRLAHLDVPADVQHLISCHVCQERLACTEYGVARYLL